MLQRDYQPIVKSVLVVIGTATWIVDLVHNLPIVPAERYAIVIVGNTLLCIVLGAFVIAIDISRYSTKGSLHLLPQTQLALCLVGLAAVLLATDGLRWFYPTATAWLFVAIALPLMSRGGFVWLWQQLAAGRTEGKGPGSSAAGPSSPSASPKMKPEHGLWLMLAAIAFIALGSLVASRTGAEQLIELAFALAAVYLAVTQVSETKQRGVLLMAGVALGVPALVAWLQLASGTLLVGGDIWRYILWARSAIAGAAAVFFGFAATSNAAPCLLVAALGVAWAAFITLGPPQNTDPSIVLVLLLVVFVLWSYWANAHLNEGMKEDTEI